MKPRRDKYTSLYTDSRGKERCVFRRNGVSRQLPHPSAPGYKEAYQAALKGAANTPLERFEPRTIDDLVSRFYRSPAFLNGGADRQRTVRGIIESFRARYGKFKVDAFQFDDIERILIAKAKKRPSGKRTIGGKVASKALQKQLKRLFKLAVRLKWIQTNPADLADGVKQDKGGWHTWTEAEIAQYRKTHPVGTMARATLEIALWTWQRKADVSTFGPKHIIDGRIKYQQSKSGKVLWLPVAPQMTQAIEALPVRGLTTFLVTHYGKPFSKAGLGNKMREWCDAADLPNCSIHGLRKAGATRAADFVEATNQQLKAAGGWSNDSEVSTYTAGADQARLAELMMNRLIEWDHKNV